MDDKDREKDHTGPGEAIEEAMPEPEEMPGDTLGRGKGDRKDEDTESDSD